MPPIKFVAAILIAATVIPKKNWNGCCRPMTNAAPRPYSGHKLPWIFRSCLPRGN